MSKTASGYSSLVETPLGRPYYHENIIKRMMETSFLPMIVNMNIASPLMHCFQEIEFLRAPVVGPWRKYEQNQTLIPDHLCVTGFSLRVCEQAYKSFKFDNQDVRMACDRWDTFENSFLTATKDSLDRSWLCYVLNALILQAHICNKNNNAGKYGDIKLGSPGSARLINGDTVAREIAALQRALVEQNQWVDGKMALLIPAAVKEILYSSPYANALQMGSCVDCSMLATGELPNQIAGFNVIVTNELKATVLSGRPEYYIIALNIDSFAFAGDIVESRIVHPSSSFSVEYQALAVWGGGSIYSEGIAVAVWTMQ